eukprot:203485-Hanusia_phi.AAC.3
MLRSFEPEKALHRSHPHPESTLSSHHETSQTRIHSVRPSRNAGQCKSVSQHGNIQQYMHGGVNFSSSLRWHIKSIQEADAQHRTLGIRRTKERRNVQIVTSRMLPPPNQITTQ